MTKPVILVVDDEKDARSTIINFLDQRYDCDFKEANDGDEAVAFVKDKPCDVMLLDIKMPKKSGMTVVKEAKEINPEIDILIISAWVSEDVAEEAMKLGATDYAIKPLDLKAISLKFENILKKRGQCISKI
ncbi:MAG: response regulator [Candidatus Omnitrophica bacterium]|nr:response regulator [Candidatus Omnitrophota bacterium]